jgi:hypothetical protein
MDSALEKDLDQFNLQFLLHKCMSAYGNDFVANRAIDAIEALYGPLPVHGGSVKVDEFKSAIDRALANRRIPGSNCDEKADKEGA